MKKMVKYIFLTAWVIGFQALADDLNRPEAASPFKNLESASEVTQFLERVDEVVQLLNGEGLTDFQAVTFIQLLESRVNINIVKMAPRSKRKLNNPEKKSAVAKQLLTPERFARLEKACLSKLKSNDEPDRVFAIRILTRGLGSSACRQELLSKLNECYEVLVAGSQLPVSSQELFAIAEGLAYLKDPAGAEVIQSVLSSTENASPALKRSAVEAADYLELPIAEDDLSDLLHSTNAVVAYYTFDLFDSDYENTTISSAAIAQLKYLYAEYKQNDKLSWNQRSLLLEVSLRLKRTLREKVLSPDQKREIKEVVILLLNADNQVVREQVVSLFSVLAQDEDSELIECLLTSDSERLRSSAALALSHCSQETIQQHKDILISLLDDKSAIVRNFALYALRIGVDDKTGNYLSEKEYTIQKARIKKLYGE